VGRKVEDEGGGGNGVGGGDLGGGVVGRKYLWEKEIVPRLWEERISS